MNEQGSNKENFVTRLEAIVEQSGLTVLDDGSDLMDEIIRQFCDYGRLANGTFGNIEEPHDDFISAAYVAFQAITVPEDVLPAMGILVAI